MYLRVPEEIRKLEKVYEPYLIGCHLENPSPEAEEAWRKVREWFKKAWDEYENEWTTK